MTTTTHTTTTGTTTTGTTTTAPTLPPHVEILSPDRVVPWDGAHWYDLAGSEHTWMTWRMAEALRLLDDLGVDRHARSRVLDVGGGAGVVRAQLEAATAWDVDLAEVDLTALAHAPAGRGRTLHYDLLDRRPELVGTYDVVVLFDVLEHIADTQPFVDALHAHLRPGGLLLVNVPAIPRAYSPYDRAAGHVRRYDRAGLRAEFPLDRFDEPHLRAWGTALVPLLLARTAWLATTGRALADAEILRRGFAAERRTTATALQAVRAVERAWPGPRPVGSSLLLATRTRC